MVQSYFDKNLIKLHIEDPVGNTGNIRRIIIDEHLFNKSYYNLILRLFDENKESLTLMKYNSFYFCILKTIGIGIGLRQDIFDIYGSEEILLQFEVKHISLNVEEDFINNDWYLANDGVLIVCYKNLTGLHILDFDS